MGRIRGGWRRAAVRIGFGFAWAVVLTVTLFGYGLDSEDARVLQEFSAGVERWQAGPDFRHVCDDYVRLSHAAMNATPWGVHATTLVMGIRSVPGLPPAYAVNPTPQAHYDNFTRGELSAYLHLCGEQTLDWVIRDLHDVAQRGASDADVERFLRSWKMNRPVAADVAAVAGVKRLLAEIDAAGSIEIRTQVQPQLAAAALALTVRMGYPADPKRLTREQQHAVYTRLDADVREHDAELWRIKQISDLCSGIWAQTFGRDYTMIIDPALTARRMARIAGPVTVIGMALFSVRQVRLRRQPAAASPE